VEHELVPVTVDEPEGQWLVQEGHEQRHDYPSLKKMIGRRPCTRQQ
jgi:hypothetical protein